MSYSLYLDDLRPCPEGFILARSSLEAIKIVQEKGMPEFMSLDHDLGDFDTGILFCNMLIIDYFESDVPNYQVHSANPVGRDNIISKMESWKKAKSL